MLTAKQNVLLQYLDGYLREKGIAPAFDEIKVAMGLRSKSVVHRHLEALEERGFIRRLKGRSRALEVLRAPHPAGSPSTNYPQPMEGVGENASGIAAQTIPCLGKIGFGWVDSPTLPPAVSFFAFPKASLNHFGMVISDDSFIEAGILQGDLAVFSRTDEIKMGVPGLFAVDNARFAFRICSHYADRIMLEASNVRLKPAIVGIRQVSCIAILSDIMRKY